MNMKEAAEKKFDYSIEAQYAKAQLRALFKQAHQFMHKNINIEDTQRIVEFVTNELHYIKLFCLKGASEFPEPKLATTMPDIAEMLTPSIRDSVYTYRNRMLSPEGT
jgi:hypothetical protein